MKRGLSMLELILALSISAIVAVAIAGMMGAVATGVTGRRDTRSVMVLANAASSRLAAYIAPSRCVLSVNGGDATLWFNDSRESNTVHASEIRWLRFNVDEGEIDVLYVKMPDGWGQPACDLEDAEYASNSDWEQVLATYQAKGLIASRTLVDRLSSATAMFGKGDVMQTKVLSYDLGFTTEADPIVMTAAACLSNHAPPQK